MKCVNCGQQIRRTSNNKAKMQTAFPSVVENWEQEKPSGIPASLEVQVIVPLTQTLIWGVIGVSWGIAIDRLIPFNIETWPFIGLTAVSYFWAQRSDFYAQSLIALEQFTGKDLNGDGTVGNVVGINDIVQVDKNRFVPMKNDDIDPNDLQSLAMIWLVNGGTISKRDPQIKKYFGRDSERYKRIYQLMRDRGLVIEYSNRPGMLTKPGYNWLREYLPNGVEAKSLHQLRTTSTPTH